MFYVRFWILFLICLCQYTWAEPLKVKVTAKSAILINAKTGAILYEKAPHDPHYPGSITKVATLTYALSQYNESYDEVVTCPYHCLKKINGSMKEAHLYRDPAYWLEPDGTHFWIKRGERLSMRDLLYGMMLVSGNDASNFIAHHVGGTIPKFMRGLNDYIKKLGCKNTYFANPHGLHHPKHATSAYDMALIMQDAIKNKIALEILATKEYERSATNMQSARIIQNTGLLLQPGKFFYPKVIGMKNGYHSHAKHTFVGAAQQGDRILIAVLLECEDPKQKYRDAIRLFEAAFSQEEETRLLFNKDENYFTREIKKGKTPLRASLMENVLINYFPSEEPEISIELNWEQLELPIAAGEWVGEMHILDQNHKILEKAPLYATRDVKKKSFIAFVDGLKTGSLDFTPLRNVLIVFLLLAVGATLYFVFKSNRSVK
ncbi:MAG: D-alanyl-D-alanine carboxypeptidase [Simkania sp.]|nr:D-alanyl-D-alanine carboxypeptidase [Simkania sp.]MCP5489738.1 D-alanyl-D-alanine carboxypeptidase [Chlamydiales bacterium]